MKINFALSLSVEGIELLHRVQRGWRRVGQTKIDSSSLAADLIELRQKALSLAPDAFTTKLIIPRDQIKYTAIDGTLTTQDDVNATLDGATPYALDDLVIDCERFGGRTHIAAVPRDTLQEAEAFAMAHGFAPVAFVAVPEPFTFQSEVFFGPTAAMPSILGAGATVERDALPVMIVGTRIKSRLLVMDESQLFQDADTLADLIAGPEQQPAPRVPAPEYPAEIIVDEPEPRARQAIWVDAIAPEYFPPAPVRMAEKAQALSAEPMIAQLMVCDKIIPETYPSRAQPEHAKPVLVATLPTGEPQAAPTAPRRARVDLPQKRGRPLLVAASVAALMAAFGGVLWSQMPAQGVTEISDQGAAAPVAVSTITPVPATPVLEDGPDVPAVEITGFGAAPEGIRPEVAVTTPTPPATVLPEALLAVPADALPRALQGPAAPPETEPVVLAEAASARELGRVLSPAEATEAYQATGVWQRAPRLIDEPSGAIALGFRPPAQTTPPARPVLPVAPVLLDLTTDLPFIAPADPPPPGVDFERDADGFILATPEGTVTPEGAVVFAGPPDLSWSLRPELSEADLNRMALLAPAPEGVDLIAGRPDFATPVRPETLDIPDPATEAVADGSQPTAPTSGSVGLASLEMQDSGAISLSSEVLENRATNDLRPRLRPTREIASANATNPDITDILEGIEAEDATLRFVTSTALAVPRSIRPQDRPSSLADVVAAVQANQTANQIEAVAAAIAPVTPAAPVAPRNTQPVPGGVARAATQEDVIRLREMNLIGIYGRPNARRALVRLSNGSYVRVEVGSALDGGQVTAIGDEALNYVKRGRTYAVEMPSG